MRTLLMGLISAAALAVDQVSKRLIEGTIEPYTSVNVLSNFDLVHTSNRGMSFGLFASDSPFSPYILSFIGLCIIVFLGVWAFRSDSATTGPPSIWPTPLSCVAWPPCCWKRRSRRRSGKRSIPDECYGFD